MKTTATTCNITSTKLSESEISLLNKGLNFCLSTKEPNKATFGQFVLLLLEVKNKRIFLW